MAGLIGKLYYNVFRRTSSFVLAAVFGAFMFERGFDMVSEGIYDTVNQGNFCQQKLWKHVKHRYGQKAEEEEEDEE